MAAGRRLADAVVPIAYAVKGEQHYQNLIAYKARRPAAGAQSRLRDLTLLFLREHWRCLASVAGGSLTDLAIVPSTRRRPGRHPLELLLAARIPLATVNASPNPAYLADDRDFHHDRFHVTLPASSSESPRRVLVLDDTWTTGGRVQSMAHALRTAGAACVITVVIGRLVKPEYDPNRELLRVAAGRPFNIGRCCLPSCLRFAG